MDTKITARIEEVGSILSIEERSQLPLIETYLTRHHNAAWELVNLDRGGRGKHEAKGSTATLIKVYKSWLVKHDRAWQLASEVQGCSGYTWDEMATATGLSSETCRQTVQALRRGGYSI